jgi:hypothetical protein
MLLFCGDYYIFIYVHMSSITPKAIQDMENLNIPNQLRRNLHGDEIDLPAGPYRSTSSYERDLRAAIAAVDRGELITTIPPEVIESLEG